MMIVMSRAVFNVINADIDKLIQNWQTFKNFKILLNLLCIIIVGTLKLIS